METNNTQAIIADTSALVSLATDTDQNHAVAVREAEKLSKAAKLIILPIDVFVETMNILGKRSGHETALQAAAAILQPDSQFILVETTLHVQASLAKFTDQPSGVSFTDCVVMAIADHYSTKNIFGFDKQFADAGYRRLEPSTDWKGIPGK